MNQPIPFGKRLKTKVNPGNTRVLAVKSSSLLIFFLLSLFILIPVQGSARVLNLHFYGNYFYDFEKINTSCRWNPGNVFELKNKDSRLALNLEGKVNFEKFRFLVSPLVTMDHGGKVKFQFRELSGLLNLGKFEITAGKAIIKFGTGYMFTPIGVITPSKQVSDPEDALRSREGGELVKIDYYTESINLSATVFKKSNWRNIALFAYGSMKGIDLYGVLYYPEYKKLEFGLAMSTAIGEAVEFHLEGMMHRRAPVVHHLAYKSNTPGTTYDEWPLYDPDDGYYKEILVGTNITLKSLNIIAEYYHNDWGLKPGWWKKLETHFDANFPGMNSNPLNAMNIGADMAILQQGRRGLFRDYFFIRASKMEKKFDYSAIVFANLADLSMLALAEVNYALIDGITLYVQPLFFLGKKGSEFGESFYSNTFQIGIRAAF